MKSSNQTNNTPLLTFLIGFAIFLSSITHAQNDSESLSFSGLFDPKPEYPYFQNTQTCPLKNSVFFSFTNAQFLAELSMLSYVREKEITISHLNQIGFKHVTILDKNGTYAIIANDEKHTIIAFRGTEAGDKMDFLTDVKIGTTNFGKKGSAHQGFVEALTQVQAELDAFLQSHHKPKTMHLWITGHSMGGALATLYSVENAKLRPNTYTLGTPRTVGQAISEMPLEFPFFRIVNDNDIVPKLLPKPFYAHIGTTIFISSEAKILVNPPALEKWKSHLNGHGNHLKEVYHRYWKRGKFNAIPSDYLADHAPINYIKMLNQAEEESAPSTSP